jgi:hypothetical protein
MRDLGDQVLEICNTHDGQHLVVLCRCLNVSVQPSANTWLDKFEIIRRFSQRFDGLR